MYSFGRLNPYNPFWGGFVHESIKNGTFKRFKNTRTEIYSLNIEDEQYNKLVKIINHFKMNTQKYSFNILGLACVSIKRKIRRKIMCKTNIRNNNNNNVFKMVKIMERFTICIQSMV